MGVGGGGGARPPTLTILRMFNVKTLRPEGADEKFFSHIRMKFFLSRLCRLFWEAFGFVSLVFWIWFCGLWSWEIFGSMDFSSRGNCQVLFIVQEDFLHGRSSAVVLVLLLFFNFSFILSRGGGGRGGGGGSWGRWGGGGSKTKGVQSFTT